MTEIRFLPPAAKSVKMQVFLKIYSLTKTSPSDIAALDKL